MFFRRLLPLLLLLPLSGCYESPGDVVIHKPGQYKGAPDSDAIMRPDDEQRAALRERFRAGQTDQ